MLETIRAYALERLEADCHAAAVRRRHAAYFQDYAAIAEARIVGPEERAWLEQLEAEHDNLRAALRWLIEQGDANGALGLSGSLRLFWQARGYLREGRTWLDAALALDGGEASYARASVLSGAGSFSPCIRIMCSAPANASTQRCRWHGL